MELNAIGKIHSPYQEKKDAPRQGRLSEEEMRLEIFEEYADCLTQIERATHLFVLYWLDRSDRSVLKSRTPFSEEPVGVFASRSPNRPNPIALCIVDVLRQEGNDLIVKGLDALDGSPIVDIKMYAAAIDCVPNNTDVNLPALKDHRPVK